MTETHLSPAYRAWLERYRRLNRAARIAADVPGLTVSGLQRRLKIGFERVTRLMQALREAGVVRPRRDREAPAFPVRA